VAAGIAVVYALVFMWLTHDRIVGSFVVAIAISFAFGYKTGHEEGYSKGTDFGIEYERRKNEHRR
jgi:hypothetical protein